ncbi:glycine cleavage system protein H [Candidatus Bathyarchaeota archaeon]|nr:MAG: glycine cleavage system protein H [Candidatus Bathyarchaeota archaeon]
MVEGYVLPDDLYYVPEDGVGNSWAKIEPDGTITIGIDDFFQKTVKTIEYVALPAVGEVVKQMEGFATIEAGKWVGRVPSPVSGKVVAVNNEVYKNPKIINEDPYGKGWLIKVKPTNLEKDLKNLIHGQEQVKKLIRKSIKKYLMD